VKARLYFETTVPSYLTAWPSRDLIRAGHQQITREWWERRRDQFEHNDMKRDEVIHEVRKAREDQAARWNFDLKAVLADARRRQKLAGRHVASFSGKPATSSS